MIPVVYNIRNLKVRKATTAATVLGLALVVFIFAAVMMVANGIRSVAARGADPAVAVILRQGINGEMQSAIEESKLGVIAMAPGVARGADGRTVVVAEYVAVVVVDKVGGGVANVQVRGMGDEGLALRSRVRVVEGRPPRPGAAEAIVGKGIRGRFEGLQVGGTLELRTNRKLAIVGVFDDNGSALESEVWGDLHTVRGAFGRTGIISSARVRLESASRFDEFKAALDANRLLNVSAIREPDYYAKVSQGSAIFLSVLGGVIALFFAVGAIIGAVITMHAAVAHRQRDIGVLRALGFSRLQILSSFLLESTVLALVAGVIGVAGALLLGVQRIAMTNFATWSELSFRLQPTPGILLGSFTIAAIMGILGGLLPAIRAASIEPARAIRGE